MERADTVPAYDLRISIPGAEPEIWRRLLLPETITIPELHVVIQAAFGWENRHLYGIRCVDRQGQSRIIVGPDEASEGLDAEPASGVVLSELLDARQPGPSTLEYEYDFGDAWTHQVEILGAAAVPAATITCVDGANRGPVEDSGGIGGYARLVEVLADPGHEEHKEISAWYRFVTGRDAGTFDPHAFVTVEVNQHLEKLSTRLWPEPPTDGEVDAVVRPVHWLLTQVSLEGIPLTQDGYLKPGLVREAMDELGWEYRWPGSSSREIHAMPILRLRQQLQDWKLLRKLKGRLVLTPKGRKMLDGGRPLWDFLAESIAFPPQDAMQLVTRITVDWLLEGMTPSWEKRERIIAGGLEAAGFRTKQGGAVGIPLDLAQDLYNEVRWALECLQLTVPERNYREEPALTEGGRKFLLQVQSLLDPPK